ncbi:MAG: hypothetical protein ACT6TH_14560 [Brevundimonas sp.]|uniref:hypothetical protein n=1 Tax=Brevundimonas sp. TaxID=1871086 RepID=UPI0040333CAA
MRAVMAFAGRQMANRAGQNAKPVSGKTMGNMSAGLSVLGSLMEYAGQRQQAAAMDQSARDEQMAGRQEFIQASERVTQIDEAYNRLVGDQLVTAAAMGIDTASGSVVAAREAAESEADRERRIIRNSAEANARVRFARSLAQREAAKNARFGSTIQLGINVASAFGG